MEKQSKKFICMICKKEMSYLGVGSHLNRVHNIKTKDYYDRYCKKDEDGFCKTCGKPTKFVNIHIGYRRFCSIVCVNSNVDIINKIKTTNIIRSGKSNGRGNDSLNKFKNTCLMRYGVENPFQSSEIKFKIKNTNLKRYGVSCYLKIEESKKACLESLKNIDRAKSQEKRKKTCLEKYGVDHEWKSREYRLSVLENFNGCSISKIEKRIQKFVLETIENNNLNITVLFNKKSIIYTFELDVYIPTLNLALEFNGTRWHSISFKEKDYHLNKSLLCRERGIRLNTFMNSKILMNT